MQGRGDWTFGGSLVGVGAFSSPDLREGCTSRTRVPKGKGQTETQVQAQGMGRRQDSSKERKRVMGFSDLSPVPTTNMRGTIRNRAPSLAADLTRMG